MDAFNDVNIRKIFFCKASQIGGTSAMVNMIMYIIMQTPAPTMIVYPSDDLAKNISNDNLKPAFRLVPEIKKMFKETKSKELELRFTHMPIYLTGAGSPSKLSSKPIKYLFFDEIDKMGGATKKEASPYNLALERTKTFRPTEKVFAASTPTIKSNYIWELHDGADEVKHYFVQCPHCGEWIEFVFDQIKFCKDDEKKMSNYERAQTAKYVCQECGCFITDSDKMKMLRSGEWRVVKKRGNGVTAKSVGFWISSLYSVFLKWSDIVEEFLDSYKDPEKLQNFTNSWLGEAWEDTRIATSNKLVLQRQTDLEEFVVPKWARMLTGGVDVQQDSLYFTIRAYGAYTTSQNITHGQVRSFADIERVMNDTYKREDGVDMVVALCLIDSGYRPDDTYDFCIENKDWAIPVKGSSNPMDSRYRFNRVDKKGYGLQLVVCDGGAFKDSIAVRLQKENGPGSFMVFKDCDENYANQLSSEQKVMVKTSAGNVMRWVPKRSHIDNHYLDCEVYAMCAAEIMGVRNLREMVMKKNRKKQAIMKIIQILIGLQVEIKEVGCDG